MKRVLILTTIMAPYRVDLFNQLGKFCELTVCFEQHIDSIRSSEWYGDKVTNFNFVTLKNWDKPIGKVKFDITKYINKKWFDLAIAYEFSTPTALVFMFLCKIKGIPYFINCDGGFINTHFIKDKIKRFFIKSATICLAGSEHASQYFIQFGAKPGNIHRHNFTSLCTEDILNELISQKECLKMKLGLYSDKKYVLSVGQFIHRKGYDVLINAWSQVDPNYELLIIGGGEKLKEHTNQIKELGLKNVTLKEFTKKEELSEHYKACDLFVLPTREDVWGLVINEAMSKGLPVIATNKCVAGLELIKDYENGFIVPVDDEKTLSHRISEILMDENIQKSMGENNLKKIKTYTIDNIAKSHIEVIENT